MSQPDSVPVAWLRPLTIGDITTIDALTEEQRAAVERCARTVPVSEVAAEEGGEYEVAYREGFDAAMEEAQFAVYGIMYHPPRRRRVSA